MCACMYSRCSINSVALYLVFIVVVIIKSITILFRDATIRCVRGSRSSTESFGRPVLASSTELVHLKLD